MEWLNYHHLLYFWVVAREGSLARASAELRLAQSTISGQIRALERSLGEKLFTKSGRRLVLTEIGRIVYRYADEIFGLGRELQDTLQGARARAGRCGWWSAWPTWCRSWSRGACSSPRSSWRRRCAWSAARTSPSACSPSSRCTSSTSCSPTRRRPVDPHARLQPPARRERHRAVRDAEARAQRTAAASRSRSTARRCLLPTENTSLRRSLDQWFAARDIRPERRRRVRGQRAARGVRPDRERHLPRALVHRRRGAAPVRGAAGRPPAGRHRALLRDLGRAQTQAPGRRRRSPPPASAAERHEGAPRARCPSRPGSWPSAPRRPAGRRPCRP